jgi:hypothetical protein
MRHVNYSSPRAINLVKNTLFSYYALIFKICVISFFVFIAFMVYYA